MQTTTLYLIPSLLSEANVPGIPPQVTAALQQCTAIYAENIRTARRFLRVVAPDVVIDNIHWEEIHKQEATAASSFHQLVKRHACIGIISEAGCPAIADPGHLLVAAAHQISTVKVVPLSGPSSILMALMASGLGGQRFAFHGYLPIEAIEKKAMVQKMVKRAEEDAATQLFMETPYRNNTLFSDLLKWLPAQIRLCIAADISDTTEWIRTMTVGDWRKTMPPELHKRPCIFLLGL